MGLTGEGQVSAPLRVAIVGAGYMAREHLRAFSGLPDVKIVGIFGRTRAKAEALCAEFSVPHVCESVEKLHAVTQADLVVVAVPELEMRKLAVACFRFGWTVLLEKPAGYNYEDSVAIVAAARASKANVFVALNRRHYSSTLRVQTALAKSSARRFIFVQDQEDPEQALADGKQPELVVQYWMYANSIHLIDFFRIFGRGRISNVNNVIPWNPSKPGVVVSHIHFDSGDQGLYQGYWNAPAPWAVSVTLPSERWELRPIEQVTVQLRGERRQQAFDQDTKDIEYKPGMRAQAEAAVAAARGQHTTLTTLAEALETVHLTREIFGV